MVFSNQNSSYSKSSEAFYQARATVESVLNGVEATIDPVRNQQLASIDATFKFECKECNITFSLESELIEHAKSDVHSPHIILQYNSSIGEIDTIDNIVKNQPVTKDEKVYDLNLLKAIEKKIAYLERDPGLQISTDRGSADKKQIYLTAETSIYEFLKINMKKEMQAKFGIDITLDRVVTAKTNNKNLKDANVEFQASTSFKKEGKSHGIKITFYENCSIFVQQLRPIPRSIDHLENFSSQTDFFVHKYLLSLSTQIIKEKPEFSGLVGNQLRQDLRKLADFVNNSNKTEVINDKQTGTKPKALKTKQNNRLIPYEKPTNCLTCNKIRTDKGTLFHCNKCNKVQHIKCCHEDMEEDDNYPLICTICIQNNPMLALEYINPIDEAEISPEIEKKNNRTTEEQIINISILDVDDTPLDAPDKNNEEDVTANDILNSDDIDEMKKKIGTWVLEAENLNKSLTEEIHVLKNNNNENKIQLKNNAIEIKRLNSENEKHLYEKGLNNSQENDKNNENKRLKITVERLLDTINRSNSERKKEKDKYEEHVQMLQTRLETNIASKVQKNNNKNEQFGQSKQLNADDITVADADDESEETNEDIFENNITEWQRVSNDRKKQRFKRIEENVNKNRSESFQKESDKQFSKKMVDYYEKRRDNYFKNDTDLRDLYVEEDDYVYKYFCVQCNYEAITITQLKKHILNTHEDMSQSDNLNKEYIHSYHCDECNYQVNSAKVLKKHKEIAHEDETQVYACHLCNFTINIKEHLKVHMKNDHTHSCNKCDLDFSSKDHLEKHFNTAHKTNDKSEKIVTRNKKKYCHFWNNRGYCKNEESCILLHEESPYCDQKENCEAYLCEYYHGDFYKKNPQHRF